MANTKLPARLLDTSPVPALTVTGDLTVDSGILKVDSTNNRVGIKTNSPSTDLDVNGTVLIDGVSNYTGLEVKGSGGSRPMIQWSNANDGDLGAIYGTESNELVLASGTSNTQRVTLTDNVVNVRKPIQNAQRGGTFDANCKHYTHLATADLYGAGNGYTVIDTNIPSYGYSGDQQMFSIFIKGYGYDQSDTGIIDMAVGAYSGENAYHNPVATGTGIPNAWKGKINIARNTSTNKVAIILGSATGANNFNIAVTDFTQSYQNEDDVAATDWNIQRLASISGYDRVTSCRVRNSQDIPAFRAYLSSNTTIGSGTGQFTTANSFSEIFDKQNNHNQSNGRFTAPQAGVYKFSGHINLNASQTSYSYLSAEIVKNGTDRYVMSGWNEAYGSDQKYHAASGSVLLDLVAGDYVTFGYEVNAACVALGTYSHTSWDGYLVS